MTSINWFMALANGNWACGRPQPACGSAIGVVAFAAWVAASLGCLLNPACLLADTAPAEREYAAYVKKGYREAETRYQGRPSDNEAAWQFARACFDLADLATNRTERAAIAERGIAACRPVIERAPNLVPAHYYLGMNLAQLAQTKTLGALKLVTQMEREFTLTCKLDEQYDYAGSDRNLGLLYRDAPSLGSIGSRTKAREHLQRAVDLAPQYPENRLNLIETYVKWADRDGAQRELQALDKIWPSARTNLAGVAWSASWGDWEQRREKARKKLASSAGKR
jgi:tetratricopeptide (TPR) repeat protein